MEAEAFLSTLRGWRLEGIWCHFLLQGILPTRESSLCLLHRQADYLPLHPQAEGLIKGHCWLWVGRKEQRAVRSVLGGKAVSALWPLGLLLQGRLPRAPRSQ